MLERLPDRVSGIGIEGNTIITSDIKDDLHVIDLLRQI
jgi:hypothetical protein